MLCSITTSFILLSQLVHYAQVHKALGGADLPLLWTVDFILDTDADGKDAYRIVRAHLTDLCSAHMQPVILPLQGQLQPHSVRSFIVCLRHGACCHVAGPGSNVMCRARSTAAASASPPS